MSEEKALERWNKRMNVVVMMVSAIVKKGWLAHACTHKVVCSAVRRACALFSCWKENEDATVRLRNGWKVESDDDFRWHSDERRMERELRIA